MKIELGRTVADKPEIGCIKAIPGEPLDVVNAKPFAVSIKLIIASF